MSVAFKVYASQCRIKRLTRGWYPHCLTSIELHWTWLADIPRVKVRANINKNVIISNLSHFYKLCPTILLPIL